MTSNLRGVVNSHQNLSGSLNQTNKLNGEIRMGILMGAKSYDDLKNKPQINGYELIGNKKAEDLMLQERMHPITNQEIEDMFK